jgi:hypothetical protein
MAHQLQEYLTSSRDISPAIGIYHITSYWDNSPATGISDQLQGYLTSYRDI